MRLDQLLWTYRRVNASAADVDTTLFEPGEAPRWPSLLKPREP